MKTLKPLSLSLLHRVVEHGRRCHFVVTGVLFVDLADPTKPLSEMDLWKTVPALLGAAALDDAMPKSRGEVLVTGSAHVAGGAAAVACEVRVRVATVDKTLRVVGDRAWDEDGVAGDPAPFTSMPLRYDRAFGGPGFPLNPTGKGFGARALPNVEDPRWLLAAPDDTAAPAGFGPYDFTWPQRATRMGTYDDRWTREEMPGLARDIDWTAFNAAPEDQWLEGYFRGDEDFALDHLHPTHATIAGRLPGLAVRAFVNLRADGGERFEEVATRLDTVHFFPEVMRAALLYRGTIEVTEDDADDVLQLVVALERAGAPRLIAHYRDVLARRLDRAHGAVASLREEDLSPDGLALSFSALRDGPAPENLRGERARRRADLQVAALRAKLAARGLDPDSYLAPAQPAASGTSADVTRAIATASAPETRAAMEAQARAQCAKRGLDYDAMMAAAKGATGGPPTSARARMLKARETLEAAKARGVDTAAMEAVLDDPALHARLAQAETDELAVYRTQAHFGPAAARQDAEVSARARAVVEQRMREGGDFTRWNLTGCDLSGLHLAGADFREALLESVDLRHANLAGAAFGGAVLVRADLSDARLSSASLRGTNLGGARLCRVVAAEPADFTGATLWGADLAGASLPGAVLDGARLHEVSFAGAELRGLSARKALFLRCELGGLRLPGASLEGATFIECSLAGADFTAATMKSASFVSSRGHDVTFRDADLENLRVVSGCSFERADFAGARLPRATLRGTRFVDANFSGAELDGSDLSQCDLTGARFERASAREAQFVRATLVSADLREAGLLGAILQKATLTGADFTGAVLFGADLARTRGRPASLAGANLHRVRVLGAT